MVAALLEADASQSGEAAVQDGLPQEGDVSQAAQSSAISSSRSVGAAGLFSRYHSTATANSLAAIAESTTIT